MEVLTNRLGRVYKRTTDDGVEEYLCKWCDEWKAPAAMTPVQPGKTHSAQCRECNLRRQKERRDNGREQYREYHRSYRESHRKEFRKADKRCRVKNKSSQRERRRRFHVTPKGRGFLLFHSCKTRAKQLGIQFSITREWVAQKMSAGVCEVTGLPFDFNLSGKQGDTGPWSPSIDRMRPSLGYTESNCRLVVWAFNSMKKHWTDAIVLKLAEAIVVSRENLRL